MVVYPQSKNPQDVVALFPVVLTCMTQVSEQLVHAGIQVSKQPQIGSVVYGQKVIAVWRWQITSLDAESILGYTTLADALLDALIYLIRNSDDPLAALGLRSGRA